MMSSNPDITPEMRDLLRAPDDELGACGSSASDFDCGLFGVRAARWLDWRGRLQEEPAAAAASRHHRHSVFPCSAAFVSASAAAASASGRGVAQGSDRLGCVRPWSVRLRRTAPLPDPAGRHGPTLQVFPSRPEISISKSVQSTNRPRRRRWTAGNLVFGRLSPVVDRSSHVRILLRFAREALQPDARSTLLLSPARAMPTRSSWCSTGAGRRTASP